MIKRIVKQALHPLFSRLRPGNVVMFHIGRCGSTVLGQQLHQNAHLFWASELYNPIFLEWKRRNRGIERVDVMPEDAIHLLRMSMRSALHRFYGFEIKPFHFRLIGYSLESFLDHLDSLGFTHFIVLDRKNRLRKITSSILAHQKGAKYHIDRSTKTRLQRCAINVNEVNIDFDTKPLIEFLSDYDAQMQALDALLQGRRFLRLTYEDHIQEDPTRAYSLICQFLNIPPAAPLVRLSRTNPFPLRDMIENIQEVEDVIRGTPYQWMLDD